MLKFRLRNLGAHVMTPPFEFFFFCAEFCQLIYLLRTAQRLKPHTRERKRTISSTNMCQFFVASSKVQKRPHASMTFLRKTHVASSSKIPIPSLFVFSTISLLAQTSLFIILLRLTPDYFTLSNARRFYSSRRASGWERVNWAYRPISLPLNIIRDLISKPGREGRGINN